ncbi:MAG: FemAB family PEP-CTERM system-associated protein [candidate division Zixibacteria bacterium]|nr:FemAB family PEP-CTERM system-associated protein [candidate division Zixibacteria bacterium]
MTIEKSTPETSQRISGECNQTLEFHPHWTDAQRWDAFVIQSETATLYHLFVWRDILEKSLGHTTRNLAVTQNGEIVGILPLTHCRSRIFGDSLISMPFLNYGGVSANSQGAADVLYDNAIALAKELKVNHLEFRNCLPVRDSHPVKLEKCTFLLPLAETEEATFAAFRKATRNRIRKVDEHGLRVERGQNILNDFYRGFAIAMKEHGTPVLPKSFFEEVLKAFGEKAAMYVAFKDNNIAGCKLTISWKDTLFQIWGGYPKAYRALLANYLLSWEATQDAIRGGLALCDFGRSNKESGPADFKRHFNCQEQQLYWEYPYLASGKLPALNPNNKKYQTAIALWKKMPLPLTRLIGPSISKNLP